MDTDESLCEEQPSVDASVIEKYQNYENEIKNMVIHKPSVIMKTSVNPEQNLYMEALQRVH